MQKITIIGAGMVGLVQAIALAAKGIDVTIIDHEDPAKILAHEFDGRVSAIAWRSARFLREIGAWQYMLPQAESILDIRVSEFGSNLFLHFDHEEIAKDGKFEPFGYIIENRFIREALFKRAAELPNLKLNAPVKWDGKYEGLLIGADGKNSAVRKMAGIGEYRKSYKQMGIVVTIEHSKPHMGLAHEHFLAAGPFAVLPMRSQMSDAKSQISENLTSGIRHLSSLVWTEPSDIAHIYYNMNDDEFLAQIRKRVKYLGEIKLHGRRWIYPLELMHADSYVKGNIALIGDAAHSIHPIAGQGVNLGFRDAEALSNIILARVERGLLVTEIALEEYNNVRRLDNSLMIAATDKLNILFSNKILPLKLTRQLGLGAVNQIAPLKRLFMKYASGKF